MKKAESCDRCRMCGYEAKKVGKRVLEAIKLTHLTFSMGEGGDATFKRFRLCPRCIRIILNALESHGLRVCEPWESDVEEST